MTTNRPLSLREANRPVVDIQGSSTIELIILSCDINTFTISNVLLSKSVFIT